VSDGATDRYKPVVLRSTTKIEPGKKGIWCFGLPKGTIRELGLGVFFLHLAREKTYLIPAGDPKLDSQGGFYLSQVEQCKYEIPKSDFLASFEGEMKKYPAMPFRDLAQMSSLYRARKNMQLFYDAKERLYNHIGLEETFSGRHEVFFGLGLHRVTHRVNAPTDKHRALRFLFGKKDKWRDGGLSRNFEDVGDFLLCSVKGDDESLRGQFIFPNGVMQRYKNRNGVVGRGLNTLYAYPPWTKPGSDPAVKVQEWQSEYWFDLTDQRNDADNIARARRIFENAADLNLSFASE